jgi:hypothetical protein
MNLDARMNQFLHTTTKLKPEPKIVAVRPRAVKDFNPKYWQKIGQVFLLNGYNGVYLMKGEKDALDL